MAFLNALAIALVLFVSITGAWGQTPTPSPSIHLHDHSTVITIRHDMVSADIWNTIGPELFAGHGAASLTAFQKELLRIFPDDMIDPRSPGISLSNIHMPDMHRVVTHLPDLLDQNPRVRSTLRAGGPLRFAAQITQERPPTTLHDGLYRMTATLTLSVQGDDPINLEVDFTFKCWSFMSLETLGRPDRWRKHLRDALITAADKAADKVECREALEESER